MVWGQNFKKNWVLICKHASNPDFSSRNFSVLSHFLFVILRKFNNFQVWWKKQGMTGKDYESMPKKIRHEWASKFIIDQLPGWPTGMSVENFVMYMTSNYPVLVKNLLVWQSDYPDLPGFDVLLNPDRYDEMMDGMEIIEKNVTEIFKNLDLNSYKTHKVSES